MKPKTKPKLAPARQRKQNQRRYDRFRLINGNHDFQKAVLQGAVEYAVRLRKEGKLGYFNYDLPREMGLIAAGHPQKMNHTLAQTVLDTIGIQFINEYDVMHHTPILKKHIKPNKYMATRYLQSQHPDKTGRTSGDGRSISNGRFPIVVRPGTCQAAEQGRPASDPRRPFKKSLLRAGPLPLGIRTSIINQYDRITGNAILEVTTKILRERKKLSFDEMQKVIQYFIQYQKLQPDSDTKNEMKNLNAEKERRSQQVMDKILGLAREHRESL